MPLRLLSTLMSVAVLCSGQATSGSAPTELKPGATGQNPVRTPAEAVPSRKNAVPAGAKTGDVSAQPYVIGPLDVLEIRVWNDAKLSGVVDVRPDGMISMALIGEIKANGLTISELTKVISQKLSSVFVDPPEVNIQPIRYNSKKFYIFGGVRRQGEFPLTADTTILDGLLNGSGFTDFANPKKIYVLRDGKKLKFNYKEVSQGKHMEQNILLQNGDRVFVPE